MNPPAPEGALTDAEAALGVRLPEALRARLLAENGGDLPRVPAAPGEEWRLLPVRDRTDRKRLTRSAEDILWWRDQLVSDGALPPGAIPIARGWSPHARLVLLPGPDGAPVDAVHQQYGRGTPEPLGVSVAGLLAGAAPTPQGPPPPQERPLPTFTYFPDPIAAGSIRASAATCPCCGYATGWAYALSPYAVETVRDLCPWCIADGSAAARWSARFSDDYPLVAEGIPDAVVAEVTQRTPGFASFQQEQWQAHCGDAAAYLGLLTPARLAGLPDDVLPVPPEWVAMFRESTRNLPFHEFRCRHCDAVLLWNDPD